MDRRSGAGRVEDPVGEEKHTLSSSASAAFWVTGVACVPVEELRHKAEEEGEKVRGEANAALQWRDTDGGAISNVEGFSARLNRVVWLRGEVGTGGGKSNGKRSASSRSTPSLSSSADVRICITDETVMCNLVPVLPRTHAEYSFVSQIVPCTLWPPPPVGTQGEHAMLALTCLQQVAALASNLHLESLRSTASFPASSPVAVALPGALVEWVAGSVGYTTDTEGLWEEQRVVAQRYYHLPPLSGESDRGAGEHRITPCTPPSTLTGAVVEQLRRFRHTHRLSGAKTCRIGTEWEPRFARLLEVTSECMEELERLTAKQSAGIFGVDVTSSCDLLLDEIILIGMMPFAESHRLSLVCPSEAFRMLTKQQQQCEHGSAGDHEELRHTVAETLLDLILRALRDALQRRICVQYELLRILRVKALALANRDLILQYTRWYSNVSTPLAVMHLLMGSTLFGSSAAQRWPCATAARVVKSEVGAKRGRDDNNGGENGAEDEDGDVMGSGDVDSEPTGDDDEPSSPSTSRDDVNPTGCRPAMTAMVGPFETDLLDKDYMTRFADWLRRHGSVGCGSGSGNSSSSNGISVNGSCGWDEVALTATIRWLRRRRRTMTLRELDAFVRKKH